MVAGWLCGSGWQGCGVGEKKWAAGIAQRGRTRTPSSLVEASTKGYVFSARRSPSFAFVRLHDRLMIAARPAHAARTPLARWPALPGRQQAQLA